MVGGMALRLVGFIYFQASCLLSLGIMELVVKNLPVNTGDIRDVGSIPGSRRSPGGGHGNPLQYSCLENPMDRGAWRSYSPRGCTELDTTEAT